MPISDIADTLAGIPVLAPILTPVTNGVASLAQQVLDRAVLTLDYDPAGTLPWTPIRSCPALPEAP